VEFLGHNVTRKICDLNAGRNCRHLIWSFFEEASSED